MSKSVMMSIRPKWCEKIISGEKTVEVRKTRPKLETPFKCYIYCTKPKYEHEDFIRTDYPKPQFYGGGKVIGEFVCDRAFQIDVLDNGSIRNWNCEHMERSCLSYEDVSAYIGREKRGYGWHISNLKIYNSPKKLDEFTGLRETRFGMEPVGIKRPPQSWCYVEVTEDV